MRTLLILLLNFAVLTAVAQPKAGIEKTDILDGKSKLLLPPALYKDNSSFTYASIHQFGDDLITPFIRIAQQRLVDVQSSPDYLLEAVTRFAQYSPFEVTKAAFAYSATSARQYYAVFKVTSSSELLVRDQAKNVVKRFILSQNEPITYYYCKIDKEVKLVQEREFESLLRYKSDRLSGFESLEALNVELATTIYEGFDKRDNRAKIIDQINKEIKCKVAMVASEIANFLFSKTNLAGMFTSGFEMHRLKKSSVAKFPLVDEKTADLKGFIANWVDDMTNAETIERLSRTASELELMGDESTDRHIQILCFSNAALGYILSGQLDKARIVRQKAVRSDKSLFGVSGHTVPALYAYFFKCDAILHSNQIDYHQLVNEATIK